jgi:hypothetical protein
MVNCCELAFERGLIDESSVERACAEWVRDVSAPDAPYFLATFMRLRLRQRNLSHLDIFSPLVTRNEFASIEWEGSAPVTATIATLRVLNTCVIGLRQWDLLTPPGEEGALAGRFMRDGRLTSEVATEFTPHETLKRYFTRLFREHFTRGERYMRPRAHPDAAVWLGFGAVLAHVGAIGCHYAWPAPLDPLVWAAVRGDLEVARSDEFIEQYALEVNPASIREKRAAAVEAFQTGDVECVKKYRAALRTEWDEHMSAFSDTYSAIYCGFSAPPSDLLKRDSQWPLFEHFRKQITKASLPVVRLWFEGLWKTACAVFCINAMFALRTAADDDKTMGEEQIRRFVDAFRNKVRDAPNGREFIAGLCGVTALLPVRTFDHKIIVVGDAMAWDMRCKPKIIVPKQKAVLFAVDRITDLLAGIDPEEAALGEQIAIDTSDFLDPYQVKFPRD